MVLFRITENEPSKMHNVRPYVYSRPWAPTELFRICVKHFQPMYKQGNRNRLLKHLKPVPTIFDPKTDDESAATSHMKTPVSTEEISKNEYFKEMTMKLNRSCAGLSLQVDKIGSPLLPDSPLELLHRIE